MAISALQSNMCNMTFRNMSTFEDEEEKDSSMPAAMTTTSLDHSATSLLGQS